MAVFGVTVKELDMNRVPLEEGWMGSNMEDEDENTNGDTRRKKLRLTKEQSRLLEERFRQNHTLNPVTLIPSPFICSSFKIIMREMLAI